MFFFADERFQFGATVRRCDVTVDRAPVRGAAGSSMCVQVFMKKGVVWNPF